MNIRKATEADLDAIADLYSKIHAANESGQMTTGWIRGVYPTAATARAALGSDSLFALIVKGKIAGAAIINQKEHYSYQKGHWSSSTKPGQAMVIHTLVIDPDYGGQGLGSAFIRFYAEYALAHNCPYLRLDTNVINKGARSFYEKMGFREAGIVKTEFNGIGGVNLVLLEADASLIKSKSA